MPPSHTYAIRAQSDLEQARREARLLAEFAGFDRVMAEMVALAVSELAANLLRYAQRGTITLSLVDEDDRTGVQVESRDQGPGIADLERAMQDEYSTGGGMGSGLPAVRRLMDEFSIDSGTEGTTVIARKWSTKPGR